MNGTKSAYSALSSLLFKRRMSVAELYKRLESKGQHFDRKSVYRLAGLKPLQTLNMSLVGAVCTELNVDLHPWARRRRSSHGSTAAPRTAWMN
jgi:hypothetical protein